MIWTRGLTRVQIILYDPNLSPRMWYVGLYHEDEHDRKEALQSWANLACHQIAYGRRNLIWRFTRTVQAWSPLQISCDGHISYLATLQWELIIRTSLSWHERPEMSILVPPHHVKLWHTLRQVRISGLESKSFFLSSPIATCIYFECGVTPFYVLTAAVSICWHRSVKVLQYRCYGNDVHIILCRCTVAWRASWNESFPSLLRKNEIDLQQTPVTTSKDC